MDPHKKKIVLGGVAVAALLSAVIYTFVSNADEERLDANVAAIVEKFACAKCGATMDLTVQQQTDMLRSRKDIFCGKCGAGGAQKQNAKVQLGRGLPETPRQPSAHPDQPLTPGGKPKPTAAGGEGMTRR